MATAIYTRISRDDLGDGLGVQRQEADCRALAARRGWAVSRVFTDNDTSAYSGRRRDAYEQLIAGITAGHIQTVLAWAPERLHRSPRQLEDFLELVERHNVTVETVKAGLWDVSTSHGRLVARMLGAVSRAESERTGERVSRAHQQAKAQGRWRGPIPFGLRASDRPGLPEVDPAQAPVVKDIYARVLRGDALTRIAADLNRDGSRPRRGTVWTHSGVQRLISSPALGGLVQVDDELRDAAFPGVIDAATWQAVQSALKSRPRGESRRPREKLTLLGGILRCAEHGHVCFGGSAAHAPTYVAAGPGRCNVSITRAAADELVSAVVLARLARPDARQVFAAPDNASHATERQALRQRRDDIAGLLAEGLLTTAAARPQLAALAERLEELHVACSAPPVDEALLYAPQQTWARMTQPQRRAVLRLLFESITLQHVGPASGPRADPTRISLTWAAQQLTTDEVAPTAAVGGR
ncbi:recombinase family protein [Geodermatophilus sp. DSM 45219]|uniref:recombinase family protein n=1 Tax=Geodermatophilus sp. DSM 45219 TaxID=1881103 RepID=UPI000881B62D|nr:recombinase family protein [Geodermatophilus sp. DSM 45219]SDN38465.1 Site-specific DNA recombinase [Geodermatophilus sp. DSM 45219]